MNATLESRELNATDRCDACGAQAYVRVILESTGGELLFCAHHARKNEQKLRPLAATLTRSNEQAEPSFEDVQRSLPNPEGFAALQQTAIGSVGALPSEADSSNAMDDLRQKLRPAPQERLARMLDLNEERTALILRKWANAQAEAI